MTTALHNAIRSGLESAIPGALTVSQWAAQYRVISPERVANPANAGRWRNEKTPYLVEIMDAVHDPAVNEVGFLKSSQVAGSESAANIIGYFSHIDPSTILYVAETEPKAEAFSNELIDPMIRDTEVLRNIYGDPKSRDKSNTTKVKKFRGGSLFIGWATSASSLSSRPVRIVILDECDAYPSTNEGDPIKLAEARTKTAGDQRKIIYITTPRDRDSSRMLVIWENSTQEKYFVPCPDCDGFQVLAWSNVKWEDDPLDAYYICEHCGVIIEHEAKFEMLARGQWRSTNPEYSGNRRFFWINEIYSPFTTWGDMAAAFLEAKEDFTKHRDNSALQVFINTRLAEWWEDKGEQIDYGDLSWHREEYDAQVPDGVLMLTAGVDIQKDRIEVEIVGWGRDNESWSIGYFVIYGEPGNDAAPGAEPDRNPTLPAVWNELRDILDDEYESALGMFKIARVCIDTGYLSDYAYKFCRKNQGRGWYPVKSSATAWVPAIYKKSKNRMGGTMFSIGADTIKDEIFGLLQVEDRGPGYCHFPATDFYNDTYFQQLCSERKITKNIAGVETKKYIKVKPSGEFKHGKSGEIIEARSRNEALDCRVYATAARCINPPNYKRLQENLEQIAKNYENNGENPTKNVNIPPIQRKRREIVMLNKRF
jgi:phage terminase large subunit GpA-like protein